MKKTGYIKETYENLTIIASDEGTHLCSESFDASYKGRTCTFEFEPNERYVTILETKESSDEIIKSTKLRLVDENDFSRLKEFTKTILDKIESAESEKLTSNVIYQEYVQLHEKLQAESNHQLINNSYNEINCDIMNEALEDIEDIYESEKKAYTSSYFWGCWRKNERNELNQGYDNRHFVKSYLQQDSSERKNLYTSPPPKLVWPLIKINQKGKSFYVSKGTIQEVAQTSYVPHLPPNLRSEESARRILNKDRASDQWQRNADKVRIERIAQFMDVESNLITNTPMLYLAQNEAVHVGINKLTIYFSKFLVKNEGNSESSDDTDELTDRITRGTDDNGNSIYEDYRPFWIIDGQHRIHGGNLSERKTQEIGLIIFDSNFDLTETAKIFAEINTLQKKLSPLHEIFMQHRFRLRHTKTRRNFRDFRSTDFETAKSENWRHEWINSRSNTLSYELLALLSSEGALYNLIQFLPQNKEANYLYSADQWIIYTCRWFSENSIYSINFESRVLAETKYDVFIDYIFYEVNEFFNALDKMYSARNYPDGKSRWINLTPGTRKPLLCRKANFAILLELYPTIRRIAKTYHEQDGGTVFSITETSFTKALQPIKNVDWLDTKLNQMYSGGGEKPRRSLQAWLSDAIQNKISYESDEIMSEEIHSTPGKGILSTLSPPEIELPPNNFPENQDYLTITSTRPYNARNEGRISVFNELDQEILTNKISHPPLEFNSTKTIKMKTNSAMKIAQQLRVRIEYTNIHTTNSGFIEIKLID